MPASLSPTGLPETLTRPWWDCEAAFDEGGVSFWVGVLLCTQQHGAAITAYWTRRIFSQFALCNNIEKIVHHRVRPKNNYPPSSTPAPLLSRGTPGTSYVGSTTRSYVARARLSSGEHNGGPFLINSLYPLFLCLCLCHPLPHSDTRTPPDFVMETTVS